MYKITPAMGWNSWNTFGAAINEKVIMETADAIVEKGLDKVGYEYVVIDDTWSLRERDENGRLVPDPEKFPHGMKYLADYVHSKGLKFGIYSCAGVVTCCGYPASYEHEYVDAATFAEWGVDFLKYDYCNRSEGTPGHLLYKRMGTALASSGRDILFSACSWGADDTMVWIKETGAHMWRSTGDINDSFGSISALIRQEIRHMQYNGQGCFNDLDMLVVGMNGNGNVAAGGCTYNEYMLHFAFWCFFGSPLMMGCDIRNMSDEAYEILTNKDLIRINQDKAGRQPFFLHKMEKNPVAGGDYYAQYDDYVIALGRYLDDGKIAIGVFNISDYKSNMWPSMLLTEAVGVPEPSGKTLLMRDIFTGKEEKATNGLYNMPCEPHSCRIFIATVVDK